MEKAELPKESGDSKRLSWVECEPLPLLQLREGRGVAPCRGDVIEAEIADVNGRAAEKVLVEALEVEPAQEGGNICGVVGPELGDYAVQILGMGKDRKSSWSTSVRLRNLKGCIARCGQLCQEVPFEESTENQRRQTQGPAKI